MAADTIVARTDGAAREESPITPQEVDAMLPSSQQSLPSTEGPASPIVGGNSFRTEPNDDRTVSPAVIPFSLTPPPSSQVPTNNGLRPTNLRGLPSSQRPSILSPPVTVANNIQRDGATSLEYTAPSPHQVVGAPPDELRSMLQACIAEHAKLKMEAAHHKLQYNLVRMQADEDAKRAAVEHEMTLREVDALRMTGHSLQARREPSIASEMAQARILQLQDAYETALADKETLRRKLKGAKKLIQETKEESMALKEERELFINRIRENREHFIQLRSPGGMFYGVATPKTQHASPAQHRSTPKQTPRTSNRDERHRGQPLDILAQAANQEYGDHSPSTPMANSRAGTRPQPKHPRGAQSLGSLPTTPIGNWPRSKHAAGLLPSIDLVPHTEPPNRHYSSRSFVPETPDRTRGRSRDSTISAEDDRERKEEYARQQQVARQALAFESVTAAAHDATPSILRTSGRHTQEEEEVYESQASQKATELLRHDPRQSFDVASSNNSRDVTPTPVATEKTARLQAKLFAAHTKSAMTQHDKRKFSGPNDRAGSPTKRLRMAGGLREGSSLGVGLGIRE